MLSALKNFGVTFLISALLFAVIAYFAVGFVTNTVTDILDEDKTTELEEIMQSGDSPAAPETVETPEQDPSLPIPEGESFSFLVITTDYRPDLYNDYHPTLESMNTVEWSEIPPEETVGCLRSDYRNIGVSSIVLVRVDKEKRQYAYTYFSPETRVYTSTGYQSMSEVYTIYGKQTLTDHVTAMTGLPIRYTFLLNGYNLDDLTELLGVMTVNNKRALYRDENGLTTQVETLVERIGDDGYPWTEHIPNESLLGEGPVEADGDTLSLMLSVKETSTMDRDAKAAETIELIQKYLYSLANMERSQMKIVLSQLITREEEWINIEGYVPPAVPPEEVSEETAEETSDEADYETEAVAEAGEAAENEGTPEADEPSTEEILFDVPPAVNDEVPFDTTPVEEENEDAAEPQIDPETGEVIEPAEEDGESEEEKEEEKPKLWILPLGEPDTAILETGFTMNDFDALFELIDAVRYFEAVTLRYPTEFKDATAENPAYFDPELEEGLNVFAPYRRYAASAGN